jgi:murein DD-endopeptidase MepM/ murein hydrolase activator NlpD
MNETISSTTNQQSSDDKKRRSWVGNRRLFLGLAAIGVGVLGYATYLTYNNAKRFSSHLLTSSLTSSSVTSLTASSLTSTSLLTSSSLTSTSKELVSLEGELYVGWDGNGIKQEGMKPLSNENMWLGYYAGTIPMTSAQTTSDSSGHWELDKIRAGDYLLCSSAASPYSGVSTREYRYMCQSNKDFAPVAETIPIAAEHYNSGWGGAYKISLSESQTMNFEFSNGFLTFPAPKGTPIRINAYVDEGNGRNYLNQSCGVAGSTGTVFAMPTGTPVVAAAPGKVVNIEEIASNGSTVVISHEEFSRFEAIFTAYDYLSEVEVSLNQEVYRGQKLGSSGENKNDVEPSLRFELSRTNECGITEILDPYASSWNTKGTCSITDLYDLGYWTKKNDPQFSV